MSNGQNEVGDFDDQLTFHRSTHAMCKYCNEVERFFRTFSYNVVHKRHYPSAWNGGQKREKFYDTMGSGSLFKHIMV